VSLLRDIQDSAVGTSAPVEVLLRQCLVLASRLQNDELREWATQELRGYRANADRPAYRKRFFTTVLGNFNGGFGSGMRNAGIPQFSVPEQLRDNLFYAEIRQGVAQIERLLADGEDTLQIPWPADVVGLLQQRTIYSGMVLMEAWQVIPATALSSVLSGIRDRVLQFALAIERENPAAGEAPPDQIPIAESRVTQIFNQNFYGDHTAVAAGGRDVVQRVTTSVDIDSLVAALRELGIHEDEQEAFVEAVREDERDGSSSPGPNTRAWLARLQNGTIQLGSGVAITTATDLILKLLHVS
jgi:hypothetical protein